MKEEWKEREKKRAKDLKLKQAADYSSIGKLIEERQMKIKEQIKLSLDTMKQSREKRKEER